MKFRSIILMLALAIGVQTTQSFAKVGIIVNRDLYPSVQTAIQSYINDLSTTDGTPVWLNAGSFISTSSKAALRDSLAKHFRDDELEGAVLIGDLPIAEYEIENDYNTYGYARFPLDLYGSRRTLGEPRQRWRVEWHGQQPGFRCAHQRNRLGQSRDLDLAHHRFDRAGSGQ
jgi:hypothetical protein